jgi:hypothetical protein
LRFQLHTFTKFFRITNNSIKGNGGSYAGGIRVGTAFLSNSNGDGFSNNTELTISRNKLLYNGGFNLAGAIGVFGGSDNYVIDGNYMCGNSCQEYGGGISHFGRSDNGKISNNLLLWNRAVDEGGGIMVGSETINAASESDYPAFAGRVSITDNVIQGCVSGDDGGGIRFLNPGLDDYYVENNIITHNVAMHEGGGVSINDAPFVHFTGNIVMNNIVTGTSLESNPNQLYAAGLSTASFSPVLRTFPKMNDYQWNFSHPQDFTDNSKFRSAVL